MFSSFNFERYTDQSLCMLLIKVYDFLTFATSSPLASLYLTEVLDALLDMPDAQPIGHLDASTSTH